MLVYFLIMAGCAAVFIYFNWIAAPVSDTTATSNLITTVYYDYDDMDLGDYTGKANIRAANGEVVYTGDIKAGVCSGSGTLWNQDGLKIYEGSFENNKFSGTGTLYNADGNPQYTGKFADNQFSGDGILYYPDKTVQYEGTFENGAFNGEGVLYNEQGIMIYEGNFQSGAYHGQGTSYYDSGIKKYEGEFYMGREQGKGIRYASSGRELFEGQFARDHIQYESLLGLSLEDAEVMLKETPIVYYSEGETSFLYEKNKVILRADCLVELKLSGTDSAEGTGWYLPDEDGETLAETEESKLDETDTAAGTTEGTTSETGSTATEKKTKEQELMESLPAGNRYYAYYYLSDEEWQPESTLDKSKITITAVTTYDNDLDLKFLEGYEMTPENGATNLQECVAIERVRFTVPTAFSSISYELVTRNSSHVEVGGINLAEAIYEEVYEADNIRYRLCYQMSEPDQLMFLTVENE